MITPLFPPQTGGIQTYLYGICSQLAVPPRVLTVAYPGYDDAAFDGEQPWETLRVPFALRRTPAALWRASRRAAVDATCILWGTLRLASLVGLMHPCLRRLPWAIFTYGKELTTAPRNGYRVLERIALRRAQAVVAISRFTAQQVVDLGTPLERVHIISPAVPQAFLDVRRDEARVAEFRARHQVGTGPVLLTLGRLVLRKGVDQVIRSLPAILRAHPGATYLIGGSGPAEPILRALVDDLRLHEHVRFMGHVADKELATCYDSADLFLMPSRVLPSGDSEGFGIVLLEAQARGVPVVAGLNGGMSDAVAPDCGLLVDGDSGDQVAAAALRVLALPAYGHEWGQRARAYVARHATEDRQRESLVALADVLESNSRG
jgi:phosphatidylinositol alpha-1,6-mannosyltransferase